MEPVNAHVKIIGTSHVSERSSQEIREAFKRFKPDLVAIELDKNRADALKKEQKSASFFAVARAAGLFGAIFYTLGRILQQRIGENLGIRPGAEMLESIRIAQENKTSIALIDRDIRHTLARMKLISRKEKIRFVLDMLRGKMASEKLSTLDLREVPTDEIVTEVIGTLKERYPAFHSVLVHERNLVMSHNIERLSKHYSRILVVVGKGHVEGMRTILISRGVLLA